MSDLRCGPLAAWTRAWLAGRSSPDEVIDAVTGEDAPHRVAGSLGDGVLLDLLVELRRRGAPPWLVLPAAGDVRGLPGPAEFRDYALDTGEALVCGGHTGGIGAVPEVVEFHPSSAPLAVTWWVYETAAVPLDQQSVPDAQYELTTAIRESASTLAAAEVGRWRDELGDSLRDARRAGESLNLPAGFPPRAVALLAQAERMQAVLELAFADPTGGAVDTYGVEVRSGALRPLAAAVRRARVTAYNAS